MSAIRRLLGREPEDDGEISALGARGQEVLDKAMAELLRHTRVMTKYDQRALAEYEAGNGAFLLKRKGV